MNLAYQLIFLLPWSAVPSFISISAQVEKENSGKQQRFFGYLNFAVADRSFFLAGLIDNFSFPCSKLALISLSRHHRIRGRRRVSPSAATTERNPSLLSSRENERRRGEGANRPLQQSVIERENCMQAHYYTIS